MIDAVLDFYVAYGHEQERFGMTIDRAGLERLLEFLPQPAVAENYAVSPQA